MQEARTKKKTIVLNFKLRTFWCLIDYLNSLHGQRQQRNVINPFF